MTDTTTLPCPFCGGDKVLISQTLDQVGPNWFAACHRATCAFIGYSLTEAEALTAWNTRANADARLVEALASYDATVVTCPANQTFLGEKSCPKCGAGSNEGCRKEIAAAEDVVRAARAALSEVSQ